MNKKIMLALEDCLQSLQNGASLEATLERHPDLTSELLPLLQAAQAAQSVDPDPVPQKAFIAGRSHLLAQVSNLRRKQGVRTGLSPVLRFALITAVVLAFLVVSGSGLIAASASSLPDDPLYGIKRTAEVIQLGLTFDPTQKDALEDEFYQRRIAETQSLLTDRRAVEIKFSGLVEARLADGWLISGIHVVVSPQTEVDGEIVPGVQAQVEGITQVNDTVLSQKISLEQDGNDGNSGSNSSGSGEIQATETLQPESGETPNPEGGSSNSGGGSGDSGGGGGSGSPTESSTSGSNGSGDITKTPEPTRTPEPTKIEALTKTPEPTKTEDPTRTAEPTK